MNKNSWLRVLILISVVFMFIYGCGGSGSDKKSTPGDTTPEQSLTPQTITGQLIDSAVSGINYSCSSGSSGTTNSTGEYTCNEGDTVIFSIGNISFPPVTAVEIVTPLVIAGSDDTNNNVVVNISRFLQTLDNNNDPSDGITIAEDTANALADKSIDFNQPVSEFETDFEVINDSIPGIPTLISQNDAIQHLNETLGNSIVGSWGIDGVSEAENYFSINFYPNGTYIHTESSIVECTIGGSGRYNGVEYGYYNYNPLTKALTIETIYDENGCIGLNSGIGLNPDTFSLSIDGNSFVITVDGEGDYTFERLVDTVKPIVGSWGITGVSGINDYFSLNFYSNGTYIQAQSQGVGDCNPENLAGGVEYGNYTYNSTTKELIIEPLVDANGCVGLSSPNDPGPTHLLTINGDSLTLTVEGEGDYVFERLK